MFDIIGDKIPYQQYSINQHCIVVKGFNGLESLVSQ